MVSLGEFKHLCDLDLAEYLAGDPPAVLLHCRVLDPLSSVEGDPGETTQRLLGLQRRVSMSVPNEFDPSVDYSVFVLEAQNSPDADEILVGCGAGCDVIISDASVSRAHAWIEKKNDAYFIRDNASAAGTKVNDTGLEVGEEREIRSGAKISLGQVDFLFLGPKEFYHFVRRLFCP